MCPGRCGPIVPDNFAAANPGWKMVCEAPRVNKFGDTSTGKKIGWAIDVVWVTY